MDTLGSVLSLHNPSNNINMNQIRSLTWQKTRRSVSNSRECLKPLCADRPYESAVGSHLKRKPVPPQGEEPAKKALQQRGRPFLGVSAADRSALAWRKSEPPQVCVPACKNESHKTVGREEGRGFSRSLETANYRSGCFYRWIFFFPEIWRT